MFKNIYYDNRKSQIHLWHEEGGEDMYDVYDWHPYVFIRDDKGDILTMDGETVKKKTFSSTKKKREYEQRRIVGIYENNVLPTIQFLAEWYHGIPDEDIQPPTLKIGFFDIEVEAIDGFPNYQEPNAPINMISIYNSIEDKIYSFGFKKLTEKIEKDSTYKHCKDEKDLIKQFIAHLRQKSYSVLSGWNIYGFDLPYFIERCKYIFGPNTRTYKNLSPIGVVNTWIRKTDGKYNIDIPGMAILDYLDAYKYFTRETPENYKLDTIAELELGEGKIDYSEYGSGFGALNTLYEKDFDKYVYYNQVDTKRVAQLEKKLAFIQGNIYGAALLTKTPMIYFNVQTKLIEGAMLTFFRRNGMCAPCHKTGEKAGWFPGAYVKDPIEAGTSGLHEWVCDLDIKSSYPSHVITLNMSSETYYGKIETYLGNDEEYYVLDDEERIKVTEYVYKREFPAFKLKTPNGIKEIKGIILEKFNAALKKGLFAIAPCGTCFVNDRRGAIAQVQRDYFLKRRQIKKEMKEAKKAGDKTKAAQLNSLQLALKITLNSTYGATSVEYSRYFNQDISVAITTCGRNTIKQAERIANDILNNPSFKDEVREIING